MRPADSPDIDPAVHDAARLIAMEHMMAALWFAFAENQKDRLGMTAGGVARELREGVLGSMVEGQIPAPFLALVRDHARKTMDAAVANAEMADRLRAGGAG